MNIGLKKPFELRVGAAASHEGIGIFLTSLTPHNPREAALTIQENGIGKEVVLHTKQNSFEINSLLLCFVHAKGDCATFVLIPKPAVTAEEAELTAQQAAKEDGYLGVLLTKKYHLLSLIYTDGKWEVGLSSGQKEPYSLKTRISIDAATGRLINMAPRRNEALPKEH